MIPVTDIVSLLKVFCHLHHVAGQPMHPVYAGTVAAMLGDCEVRLIEAEQSRSTRTPPAAAFEGENIIRVNFNRSAPSDGGDAA